MKTKTLSVFIIIMIFLSIPSCNDGKNKNSEKFTFTNTSNVMGKDEGTNVNNEDNKQGETAEKNIYKEDYLEACRLFADKYIFLEEKIGKSREVFLKERIKYSDKVDWSDGQEIFIKEIRELCALFPDENVSFKLSEELRKESKFLGFMCKYSLDGKVIVDRVYDEYFELDKTSSRLHSGYEIIEWNGRPIEDVIKELGEVNKKSSFNAQNEVAARFLTVENGYMPLRDELKPIEIVYKKGGERYYEKLEWKRLKDTYSYIEYKENEEKSVLILNNHKPSLEDIPKTYRFINESLIYYFREIDGIWIAVLHPRDFISWNHKDLNKTMEGILSNNPDVLLVDLEDTLGGSEKNLLELVKAINIDSKMIMKNEYLNSNKENNSKTKYSDYYDKIIIENKWVGPVLVRTNSVTSGAGEYFARWVQQNKRGIIFGHPTAGSGGIHEVFSLNNTGTEIEFSVGSGTIDGNEKPVEGNPVIPNILYDESMRETYSYDWAIVDFFSTYGKELFSEEIIKKAEQRIKENFDWRNWNTFGDTVIEKCEEEEWDEAITINYKTDVYEPNTRVNFEERNNPNELLIRINNARYSSFNFKGMEESKFISEHYYLPVMCDDTWEYVFRLKKTVQWEFEEKYNPYRQVIKLREKESIEEISGYSIITNYIGGETMWHLPDMIENSKIVKIGDELLIQIGYFSNKEECEVRANELREEYKEQVENLKFTVVKIEDINY